MTHTSVPGRSAAVVGALLLLLAVGLPVEAGQAFKWWESDRFQRELVLTPDQSRRIEAIFQEALPGLRAQKKALDDAEAAFERLVERGDENLVLAQVERVEGARSDLNVSRTMMLVRMRRVLTPAQWERFTLLHQTLERERLAAAEHTDVRGR